MKLVSFYLSCLMIIAIAGCTSSSSNSEPELLRMAISPDNAASRTYFIRVKEDGQMSVSFGGRVSPSIYGKKFMEGKSDHYNKKLSSMEMESLKAWIDIIKQYEEIEFDMAITGGNALIIGHNQKEYKIFDILFNERNYKILKGDKGTNLTFDQLLIFKHLTENIIKLSPVELDINPLS